MSSSDEADESIIAGDIDTEGNEVRLNAQRTLVECTEFMLQNGIASDVSFSVHGADRNKVVFKANKCMLMSRSDVFKSMFSGSFKEKNGKVTIDDIEPEVFKEMLSFVYTDRPKITYGNAFDLIYTAKKYLMPLLKDQCIAHLLGVLDSDNVCEVYSYGLENEEHYLSRQCKIFMIDNALDVLGSSRFTDLSPHALETLIKNASFCVKGKPVTIFRSCVKWANSVKSDSPQTIREKLQDLFYLIRFCGMDLKSFIDEVNLLDLMTQEEFRLFTVYLRKGQKYLDARQKLAEIGFNVSRYYRVSIFCNDALLTEPTTNIFILSFSSNSPIQLYGLSISFVAETNSLNHFSTKVTVSDTNKELTKQSFEFETLLNGDLQTTNLFFCDDVILNENTKYIVRLKCESFIDIQEIYDTLQGEINVIDDLKITLYKTRRYPNVITRLLVKEIQQ